MKADEYRYLYRQNKWKTRARTYLVSHPACSICGKFATVVDHKRPHKGNLSLFWDEDNWQSLCKHCHDSVKYRLEMGQEPGKDFVPNNEADGEGLPLSDDHPWNKDKH